ncbi:taste receptor type 1 member 2-like [Kryptolebias marmoratus]|uniref:Taste receptor type 1 member 2-like n=1 Tax=Kryptolebias marmoratus TaxID=37003 RepID=A0A3Q3ANM0_KRYMA|nr:taste receptor type 1 member 2-like [Kryptolebias marmoratus]
MRHFVSLVSLLGFFLHLMSQCSVATSEFHLDGDYLIGGLFDIHVVDGSAYLKRPEPIDCSSHVFSLSSYRRFQLMRFSVEQINNSTSLLPNVSLGYEIFDLCSDTQSFPGILNLISENGLVPPWGEQHNNLSYSPKAIAVVGPFTSTDTLTVAPLFTPDLIPMVSYGAASSAFSEKNKFPSFLRTVPSNKEMIDILVAIILHFNWRWVAFLNSDNDFGNDGLELFRQRIKDTNICMAYTKGLNDKTDYAQLFTQIEAQKITVIVVFTTNLNGEALIESAIKLNITKKVWIAGDTWSLNKKLLKTKGIIYIGTVLGVSQSVVHIPGLSDFIYSTKSKMPREQDVFCNQDCNCSSLLPEDVISLDPTFSFPVYSAVFAIAHALHNILQCEAFTCNDNIKAYPYMVLEELLKSNFTLLNVSIQFDENGNPRFGSYSIVFWNQSGDAQEIGLYTFFPSVSFFINSSIIKWHTNNQVPISQCSSECPVGYSETQNGLHKCCFKCKICPNGTYINPAENPYKCISCKETEWSPEGSTSCKLRLVEYISFTDSEAVVIMVGAWVFWGQTLVVSVLFAINYNTPVVRSAGGPMCILILACLSLSDISVFFYFGEPTVASCILRYFPFLLFYTVCLACFVVRSFQIVCVFKMAIKFPMLHSWWMKYHGQWLLITGSFITQAVLLIAGHIYGTPNPHRNTLVYQDRIILGCDINIAATSVFVVLPFILCMLCFIFSYMGKDLPKNYNEAKAITFCLLLLIFTWMFFATAYLLYQGKHIHTFNALAILSSLFSFLLWYFLPKCYIIVFQPHKNTQQYFQGLIQNYTKTFSH